MWIPREYIVKILIHKEKTVTMWQMLTRLIVVTWWSFHKIYKYKPLGSKPETNMSSINSVCQLYPMKETEKIDKNLMQRKLPHICIYKAPKRITWQAEIGRISPFYICFLFLFITFWIIQKITYFIYNNNYLGRPTEL